MNFINKWGNIIFSVALGITITVIAVIIGQETTSNSANEAAVKIEVAQIDRLILQLDAGITFNSGLRQRMLVEQNAYQSMINGFTNRPEKLSYCEKDLVQTLSALLEKSKVDQDRVDQQIEKMEKFKKEQESERKKLQELL